MLHWNNNLNKIWNKIFIPFCHISLLDSATYVGNNLQVQEEINDDENDEEPVEEMISTDVATIEKSATSSSASAKRNTKN